MQNEYHVAELFRTVVEGNYCIGCGACASLKNSPISMEFNEFGFYRPVLQTGYIDNEKAFDAGAVCPFYPHEQDETKLGDELYSTAPNHTYVGKYLGLFAAYVNEGMYRRQGSSGGMTSWILAQLLESGDIDGVVHVGSGGERLFEYQVSLSQAEVTERAKSRYYPVEVSQVMTFVREKPGKYAFVGVPCFVKAVRLLARKDPEISKAIKYCIAIFCGHMKSAAFAEMFAWQLGIEPHHLESFDFRVKLDGKPAHRYGVQATGIAQEQSKSVTKPVNNLYGGNWGHGLFKPQACDYCDDIAGETADVSLGDAWLPGYQDDGRGTNVVIVRHPTIQQLLEKGERQQNITLFPLDVKDIYASQAGNFRHRRDGLAYRLHLKDTSGEWRPNKRVLASRDHLSPTRRRIYELRTIIAEKSHTAFLNAKRRKDFSVFQQELSPLIKAYENAYNPLWRRIGRKLKRIVYDWMKQ